MRERWRAIPGEHECYEVSDRGRVRSWLSPGRSNKRRTIPLIRAIQRCKKDGYLYVILVGGGVKPRARKIHLMVLSAFDGPKPNRRAECRHLDGNQLNNARRNLAWGTHRQNFLDQVRHGTDTRAERNGGAKLTNREALLIRASTDLGWQLASLYGVSQATISRVRNLQRYAVAS